MVLEFWYVCFDFMYKLQNGSNLPKLAPTQSSPPLPDKISFQSPIADQPPSRLKIQLTSVFFYQPLPV